METEICEPEERDQLGEGEVQKLQRGKLEISREKGGREKQSLKPETMNSDVTSTAPGSLPLSVYSLSVTPFYLLSLHPPPPLLHLEDLSSERTFYSGGLVCCPNKNYLNM